MYIYTERENPEKLNNLTLNSDLQTYCTHDSYLLGQNYHLQCSPSSWFLGIVQPDNCFLICISYMYTAPNDVVRNYCLAASLFSESCLCRYINSKCFQELQKSQYNLLGILKVLEVHLLLFFDRQVPWFYSSILNRDFLA